MMTWIIIFGRNLNLSAPVHVFVYSFVCCKMAQEKEALPSKHSYRTNVNDDGIPQHKDPIQRPCGNCGATTNVFRAEHFSTSYDAAFNRLCPDIQKRIQLHAFNYDVMGRNGYWVFRIHACRPCINSFKLGCCFV